ncbi:hypothetical protein FRB95_006707 [Tulasnella sp. JGI-2019a]|nr:hypothetical protein FRB93_007855 [Tulasnella sp. JGI-2019a]KAG9037153.1 hypothetical protein FRB95_006707 [Tulasnella sp. JGI-2019a]
MSAHDDAMPGIMPTAGGCLRRHYTHVQETQPSQAFHFPLSSHPTFLSTTMRFSSFIVAGLSAISAMAAPPLSTPRAPLEVYFLGSPLSAVAQEQITNAVTQFWLTRPELSYSHSAAVHGGGWHWDEYDRTIHASVTFSRWRYTAHVYENGTGNLRPDLVVQKMDDAQAESIEQLVVS